MVHLEIMGSFEETPRATLTLIGQELREIIRSRINSDEVSVGCRFSASISDVGCTDYAIIGLYGVSFDYELQESVRAIFNQHLPRIKKIGLVRGPDILKILKT